MDRRGFFRTAAAGLAALFTGAAAAAPKPDGFKYLPHLVNVPRWPYDRELLRRLNEAIACNRVIPFRVLPFPVAYRELG